MQSRSPIRHAIGRALSGFVAMLPVLLGVLLLSSLLQQFIPKLLESGLMGAHQVSDALVGAAAGSISAGHPLVSYLLGGELLKGGVGLAAVSALVVAWVTVGLAHLPLEAVTLGRRFAILRNLLSFLFAVTGALLISGAVHVFGSGTSAGQGFQAALRGMAIPWGGSATAPRGVLARPRPERSGPGRFRPGSATAAAGTRGDAAADGAGQPMGEAAADRPPSGRESGLRGWAIAITAGVVSLGPMYLWYPMLGELKEKGVCTPLLAAFLYSRAVKIPLLPMMAHYFGLLYTLLFVLIILLFSVLSGLGMGMLERARSNPR